MIFLGLGCVIISVVIFFIDQWIFRNQVSGMCSRMLEHRLPRMRETSARITLFAVIVFIVGIIIFIIGLIQLFL